MVEMSETANILNHATPRRLIILDAIGRGTSTFAGLSLAWSIVEHLHNAVAAKTLFATRYHELTELAARLPRLKDFTVATGGLRWLPPATPVIPPKRFPDIRPAWPD